MTKVLTEKTLAQAADLIREGQVVAVPTETVYGLAADALNETAIRRIYEAKGRPENKPISAFVPDMQAAEKLCEDIPQTAYALAERFWPGPLTLVLKKRPGVPEILTAGGETVGVRCPDHPLTLALLEMLGGPLTGTSANRSGEANTVSCEEVLAAFRGRIPAVVDGGACGGGIPSSVLDLTGPEPRILRAGGVTGEMISSVLEEAGL